MIQTQTAAQAGPDQTFFPGGGGGFGLGDLLGGLDLGGSTPVGTGDTKDKDSPPSGISKGISTILDNLLGLIFPGYKIYQEQGKSGIFIAIGLMLVALILVVGGILLIVGSGPTQALSQLAESVDEKKSRDAKYQIDIEKMAAKAAKKAARANKPRKKARRKKKEND